ncbi:hypothetical protein SDC9_196823 [bioreactor metagenome]|uniref:Uncharacterized protein n=1 Tax=bioreactor metagenome TaxID=1076179 RepID=A0A645ID22_9ZZZZ
MRAFDGCAQQGLHVVGFGYLVGIIFVIIVLMKVCGYHDGELTVGVKPQGTVACGRGGGRTHGRQKDQGGRQYGGGQAIFHLH